MSTSKTSKLFSVIIPACNRTDDLCQVLDSLADGKQTLDFNRYEVIVTDDGNGTATENIIHERYPWVSYIRGPRSGPAANRNNGASIAEGDWLIFTDDDCVVDSDWLSAYARHANGTAQAMEGSIEPIGEMNHVFCECPVNTTGGLFWSANIAVKRSLFEKVQGFDTNFLYPAHEDADLRERLLPLTTIVFVKDAKVRHPIRIPNVREKFALTVKRCSAWTYFQGKHQRLAARLDNYLRLVFGWMRVYSAYAQHNIRVRSIPGVFVSFLALFVIGPYAIFKTMFCSPEYKNLESKR